MEPTSSHSFSVYDVLAWAEANRKTLLIAVGVVALAGTAAAIFFAMERQREQEAYGALLRLPGTAQSSVGSQDYLRIAESHGPTKAGERASFIAASTLFKEGKFAEAQAQFESFLAQHPDSPLHALAALGAATSIEAQGKRQEAVTAYQQVLTRYPDDNTALQAKLFLARIHEEEGRPGDALRLYNELVRPAQMDAWSAEAEQRREQLQQRHPELVKPKETAPAVEAPAAPQE